ncbi:unnamed protein product [Arabidopsis lyrata]|uniref:Expressed protein n=1 Tax=Arabidopsis lyrata subsp. lyrata TaxID=81972 RepID=D7LCQ6_ARALL|nr:expressed protein [Arabidopsis lyrata subsp. lyrata]CAH8263640.1 unnamed protein product [Arabidopsis lyrata]
MGSPRDGGGRLRPDEAKPPSMVLRSTPYCLQLSRLSMEIHDKGWSDLFFLLKTALRWQDGNRSWITISVRHASSMFTGDFLFWRVYAVLGRRLCRVLRLEIRVFLWLRFRSVK